MFPLETTADLQLPMEEGRHNKSTTVEYDPLCVTGAGEANTPSIGDHWPTVASQSVENSVGAQQMSEEAGKGLHPGRLKCDTPS